MMRPHTLDTSAMLRLRKHNLYAREDKCSFHQTSVEYLGYILLPEGLTMAEEKVKCILEWPEPQKVKDIQSFLGFENFYRLFINNYSAITVPLLDSHGKDSLGTSQR